MRYIGIDFGEKRVGVAVSDEDGKIAFPYAILDNKKGLVNEVRGICSRESADTIVIGESLDYKGKPNLIMKKVDNFIKELKEVVSVPIVSEREFMTTQQARFYQSKRKRVDDSAAAIILQSYLDRKAQKER